MSILSKVASHLKGKAEQMPVPKKTFDLKSNFRMGVHHTNLLRSREDIQGWIERLETLPVEGKIDLMRSSFYEMDFDRFWEIEPSGTDYKAQVLKAFETIAGRPYDIKSEPIEQSARNLKAPFPYYTGSNTHIGENLIGVGAVCKNMPAAPGANVLEMGCGWANTSLTLARSGYHVTSVDIDPSCKDLVDYWSPRLHAENNIRFVESNFDDVTDVLGADENFDVVLFFKSFHHCLNPHELLGACNRQLKDGGYLFLASEPIHKNFYVPWGIRCDGTSVFAIARNGWLELGFDRAYFDFIAEEAGFELFKENASAEIPTLNGLIYRKVALPAG